MMTDNAFEEWLVKNRLSADATVVIRSIRKSDPSRLVRSSAAGNVSGRFPSIKMGLTIQFESHHVELPAIAMKERNPKVIEYYDQPPPILLQYSGPNGRNLGHYHTPDFFTIWENEAGWEEWKPEEQLEKISKKNPNRYYKDNNAQWRCPSGEAYAQKYGLYYRVHSSAEISSAYYRNMLFLDDYYRADTVDVPKELRDKIQSIIRAEQGLLLSRLLQTIDPKDVDAIYTLVSRDEIYVDLEDAPLADPTLVKLYTDITTATAFRIVPTTRDYAQKFPAVVLKANTNVLWDGVPWKILNVGTTQLTLSNDSHQIAILDVAVFESFVKNGVISGIAVSESTDDIRDSGELKPLESAGLKDLEEANHRAQIIDQANRGETASTLAVAERTLRRWMKRYRLAQKQSGIGYLGLLPDHKNKGNPDKKMSLIVYPMINSFIEKDYLDLRGKSKITVYRKARLKFEKNGIQPPSYKTFWKMIKKKISHSEEKRHRAGPRAAYPLEIKHWVLDYSTPVHGDRPFEICHIDHTELDIEVVSSRTGSNLGRPWGTFLVDAYSRRILAVYISFESPSYRSCMMVLRECVRRYGRLPQTIVVDGGKEFGSIYFQALAAVFSVTIKTRPAGQARAGSIIERVFNTTVAMFIHNLLGNTRIMKNVRQVVKSVNPKTLAVWTLIDFYEMLTEFAYEVYDTNHHGTLGLSPRDFYSRNVLTTGARDFKLIPYTDIFKLLTLPSPKQGTGKVQPGKGIEINNLYYWNSAFDNPDIVSTRVEKRYDPFNAGVAYAYVNKTWVKCISELNYIFEGHTESEILALTKELKKQLQHDEKDDDITARKLADFMQKVEDREQFLLRRMRAIENRQVLNIINNDVTPPDASSVRTTPEAHPADSDEGEASDIDPAKLPHYGEYKL